MSGLERSLPRSWWLKRPGYFWFMVRELTSLAVFAYAVLLILALRSIGNGDSFAAFYEALSSPVSVWAHGAILLLALFHTGTWIALTPKVLVLWNNDEPVEPDVVAGANGILFLAVSGLLLWLVMA